MQQAPSLRGIRLSTVWPSLLLVVACAVVPVQEFNSYREAFGEVKAQTELLLLEYDAAKQAEAQHRSNQAPALRATTPYPAEITLTLNSPGAASTDPVAVRRQALNVVSSFNEVLAVLAEGRSVEEVKSSVETLVGGINKLGELLGGVADVATAIPYAGQITALVSTVVTKAEEAHNRAQFVAAMREAEPIIRAILAQFAADAETIYEIRAKQADRKWSGHQDTVATLVRQMRGVSKEYKTPIGPLAAELVRVEQETRKVLDRTGLTDNTEKLLTTGSKPFDQLALSQLEQTLAQAAEAARKYEAIIMEQKVLGELILSYGAMLAQTNTSLITVRAALDSPPDIRAQARDLIAFAFAVRRDWEALDEARRAAAGS